MTINEKIQWWKNHPPKMGTISRGCAKSDYMIRQTIEICQRHALKEKKPCFINVSKEDFEEFLELYPNSLTFDKFEESTDGLYYELKYFDKDSLIAECAVYKCESGEDNGSEYYVCANWDECYQLKSDDFYHLYHTFDLCGCNNPYGGEIWFEKCVFSQDVCAGEQYWTLTTWNKECQNEWKRVAMNFNFCPKCGRDLRNSYKEKSF